MIPFISAFAFPKNPKDSFSLLLGLDNLTRMGLFVSVPRLPGQVFVTTLASVRLVRINDRVACVLLDIGASITIANISFLHKHSLPWAQQKGVVNRKEQPQ